MPWKLLESTQGYIFVWLTGYGALLGPVAGILIADYWLLRRARLDVEALYDRAGRYTYFKGWNLAAVAAFVIGVAPNLPGFLKAAGLPAAAGIGAPWTGLYDYAWFVGAGIAAAVYVAAMRAGGGAKASAVG
jgi:NCS1 family nucleobase:cation symporter-1